MNLEYEVWKEIFAVCFSIEHILNCVPNLKTTLRVLEYREFD